MKHTPSSAQASQSSAPAAGAMPTRRPQRLSTARIVLLAVLVTLALLCVGYLVYFVPALIRNARRQRELDPHMNPYDDSSSGSGSGGSGGDDDEHQQTPPPLQPQRQQPRRGAGARNSSSGFGDGLVPLDPNDPWVCGGAARYPHRRGRVEVNLTEK